MRLLRPALLVAGLFLFGSAFSIHTSRAQTGQASQMYDIAFNGTPVTIDGDLSDWSDAQFLFLSQDKINFLDPTGKPIQGTPLSPADFSGFFGMKMDADNIYFAIKVRDEETPMIEVPATPNLAFVYDHLSVYLGLYDIGDLPGSPHLEGPLGIIRPTSGDTVTSIRTYRIAPGTDVSSSTLGPDYQLMIRAIPYGDGAGGSATGDDVQTYSGALVDTTIQDTEAASVLTEDETGYTLEWRIPFASLAGNIAKPSREYAEMTWPLFEPTHDAVIVFDADLTDLDDGESTGGGATRFLRLGNKPALWRDSKSFGMRGRIVDLSLHPNDAPSSNYYLSYESEQEITIDGDLSDWLGASFVGMSQDKINFLDPTGKPIQGVPTSPADFSGYIGMMMDDENLYVAAKVYDEETPMIEVPATPNLAFVYDHISMYLGLYDIGDLPGSPHVEGPLGFIRPVSGDTITSIRTYRIYPGADVSTTTLGADYQLLLRSIPYGDGAGSSVQGDAVQTYSGALVDTTIQDTEASSRLTDEETGYTIEWRIPLSSLAGSISKPSREYAEYEWPLFVPAEGQTIVFDADLTDLDDGESTGGGATRFIRAGNKPALWRDSKSFGMRGKLVSQGRFSPPSPVSIEDDPAFELPTGVTLSANYPNPFNPSTQIQFAMAASGPATLQVFDLLGREVATLFDGIAPAGVSQVTFRADDALSSGMYVYRLVTPASVTSRTMVLLK